jgi:PAS domain S-box-containing protein
MGSDAGTEGTDGGGIDARQEDLLQTEAAYRGEKMRARRTGDGSSSTGKASSIDTDDLLAKYEAIVEAFEGLVYICSENYDVEFMNQRSIERTGYNALGQKCYKALHDLPDVCSWCVNDRVFKGETVRWEVKSPKDNRWYYIVNTPVRHKDGSLSKMAMIRDITEQKETEEALKRGERFLSSIFASIQDGISVLDDRLNIIRVNPVMEKWNQSSLPLIGKKCYEAYHDRRVPCDVCPSKKTLQTGKAAYEIVPKTNREGEVTGWVDLYSFPFFDVETGELKGVIEYARDITARKNAEEKIKTLNRYLEKRAQELEIANKELEAFNYSVSHDLKSPLIAIEGICRIILKKYSDRLDVKVKDYIGNISGTAKRTQDVIADLLNLSRAMRKDIRHEMVDLSRMAHKITEALRKKYPERSVEFVAAEGVKVRGDEGLLSIAMENLIGNAWKFTGRNRHAKIEFGVTQRAGRSVWFVRDDGVGFDAGKAEKLFDAFVRLHPKEEFEGTGIGLTTVQRIIQRHGGEIWAESTEGTGATFYFTLPRGEESTPPLPIEGEH